MVQISDDILKAVPISEDELRQKIAVLLYRKGLPPRNSFPISVYHILHISMICVPGCG